MMLNVKVREINLNLDSSQVVLKNVLFFCIQVTQKTGLLRLVVETPSDQTSAAKIESFKDLLGENIADDTPVVSTLYTSRVVWQYQHTWSHLT